MLCAAALLMLFAPGAVAADDLDDLKSAVSDAEKEFVAADKAERAAFKKVSDNNAAQKNAQGAELQRLKSEAVDLKTEARNATNKRLQTQRTLALKRAALRKEASKVAEEQVSGSGDVNARVKRAGEALEIWKNALGELLTPPEVRKCEGLDDVEAAAQKRDDKQRLEDYVTWASAEKSNVETELKRAQAIVKGEAALKGADGHARMLSDAKTLSETLESRKSSVEGYLKTAKDRLKSLEK